MKTRILFRTAPILAALLCVSGCSDNRPGSAEGSGTGDIRAGYDKWAKANATAQGGKIYELLDSGQRADVELMGRQWAGGRGMTNLSGRDAFVTMIDSIGGSVADRFKGDYEILAVDTLYAVTVRHTGRPVDVVIMRRENGEYRYTVPPTPASAAIKHGMVPPRPAPVPAPAPADTAGSGRASGTAR